MSGSYGEPSFDDDVTSASQEMDEFEIWYDTYRADVEKLFQRLMTVLPNMGGSIHYTDTDDFADFLYTSYVEEC